MISIPVDDLLRIHRRLSLLAFLLSICNPSTVFGSLTFKSERSRPLQAIRSPSLKRLSPFGVPLPFHKHIPVTLWFHDLLLHVIAGGCVALIMSQMLFLGIRGVIAFACPTWHDPITWTSVGWILYLLHVVSWRMCLGTISRPLEKKWSRWSLYPTRLDSNLTVMRPRLARFFDLLFQVTGILNYGYGTVILSGTTLVNPFFAFRFVALVGVSSILGRLIALWLLSVYPGCKIDVYRLNGDEMQNGVPLAIVERDTVLQSSPRECRA